MVRLTPTRVALALWCVAIASGFRALVDYELTAGSPAKAPAQWPADSGLRFDATRANLVMFAHPRCPCSGASLAELAAILARCGDGIAVTVCFFSPDTAADCSRSALWRSASALPGANVIADPNGEIAARFGATTSGQVLLFDHEGNRVFHGGITGARGHEGDNAGRALAIAVARGEVCGAETSPVFGCALRDPAQRSENSAQ